MMVMVMVMVIEGSDPNPKRCLLGSQDHPRIMIDLEYTYFYARSQSSVTLAG